MNRDLDLKPSQTRSHTEIATKYKGGPEATANLTSVETAEHLTGAVSHKIRDPSSSEYIKISNLCSNTVQLTT